jgi:crotonobetainyl-CoA:carnitine CoA-transferase CaiB-like acyl-CoA transferase
MLDDPQYVARETITRVFDAVLGHDVPMATVVPRLSRTPGTIRWPGAGVGAHTHEVLAELGLDDAQRQALVDALNSLLVAATPTPTPLTAASSEPSSPP